MKLPTRAGVLLGCVVAVSIVLGGAAAGAPTDVESGWWWRPPAAAGLSAPIPPPVTVEPGELVISRGPGDSMAVAAVRAIVGSPASDVRLRLDVSNAINAEAVTLVACSAFDWEPTVGGDWEDQPRADCRQSVEGVASPDRSAWAFEVTPLVRNGVLDTIVMSQAIPDVAGFELHFLPPGPGSVDVHTLGGATSSTTLVPATSPSPPATTLAPFGGTGGIALPTLPPPAVETSDDPDSRSRQQPSGTVDVAPPVRAAFVGPSGLRRLLAAAFCLICVAAGMAMPRQAAASGIGGLNRFANPRTGRPPALL